MNKIAMMTVAHCVAYYKQVQADFAAACKFARNGKFIATMDFSINLDHYFTPTEDIRGYLADNNSRLHTGTIHSAVEVAVGIANKINIGLLGLVQCGKTPTLFVGGVLGCLLLHLKTGRYVQPIYLTPNVDTCTSQFQSKSLRLLDCISHMVVTYKGKSMTVGQYLLNLRQHNSMIIPQIKAVKYNTMNKVAFRKLSDQLDVLLRDNFVILPMSKKYKSLVETVVAASMQSDGHIVILRDESHYAIQEGGTNDQMFHDVDLYNLLGSRQPNRATAVMCSATNWASHHLTKIRVRISQGYTGLDYAYIKNELPCESGKSDSERFDTVAGDIAITNPEATSLNLFANITRNSDMVYMNPTWYSDENQFEKNRKNKKLPFKNHADYRKKMSQSLARCIIDVFNGECPSGKKRKHRGMLVRFCNNNIVMNSLLENLVRFLPDDIKVIKAYSADEYFTTVDDLLNNNGVAQSGRYIIFVTARGRMSDSFPRDCGFGLDFTSNTDCLAALIQGVYGRMCGYWKDPFVLLSHNNYQRVQKLIKDNYVPSGKLVNSISSKSQPVNLALNRFHREVESNPTIRKLFNEAQRYVDLATKKLGKTPITERGKTKYRLVLGERSMNKMGVNFWEKHLAKNADLIDQVLLQTYPGVTKSSKILRPNEKDEMGHFLKVCRGSLGPVLSVRTGGKNYHDHHGGKDKTTLFRQIVLRLEEIVDGNMIAPNGANVSFNLTAIYFPIYQLKNPPQDLGVNPSVASKIVNTRKAV